MIKRNAFPILEFDDDKNAKINPTHLMERGFEYNKLVITFFPEVINKLLDEQMIDNYYYIGGENPIQVYKYTDGSNVLIVLGQVGCPACGGNLDLFNAMGITKVMFCGGGGVLDKNIEVGQLLLVEGAIRDEGFSYHYLEAGRIVEANKKVNAKVETYLVENNIPYLKGLVWTTDAIFRETNEKIALRKNEGAKIVEMEQSGCLAVAKFRNFDYAALIYGGDDCESEEWSNRDWKSRNDIRYDLVNLCKSLVQII